MATAPKIDKTNVNVSDYGTRVMDFIARHPDSKELVDQIHTYVMVILQGEFRPFPFVSPHTHCYNVTIGEVGYVGFDIDFDDEETPETPNPDPDLLYVDIYYNEFSRYENTDTLHSFTLENFLQFLSTGKAEDREGVMVDMDNLKPPLEEYSA